MRFLGVVRVKGGTKRQFKRRFVTLEAAREWVAEMRDEDTKAKTEDASLLTVRDLCERWMAHQTTTNSGRPGTRRGYGSHMASILAVLGDERARTATPGMVEVALAKLAKEGGVRKRPLSHSSLLSARFNLRQAYAHAMREGWVKANPALPAKLPIKPKKVRVAKKMSVADVQKFRTHIDTAYSDPSRLAAEPWVPVAMRLALCGLRRSEIVAVDWRAVDIEAGTVDVAASRTATGEGRKTSIEDVKSKNSERTVPVEVMHPGTKQALKKLWIAQGQPASGLVIRDALGEPFHPDIVSDRFKTLCGEAGIEWPGTIHATRHTLATALHENGTPPNKAAKLLGHDVATYLATYVVADDNDAATAAKDVGAIFATG